MWKWEDGDGESAVGPAWIDTVEDGGRAHSEKAAGGDWISREEARKLAAENGWEYLEDAPEDPNPDAPVGDIDARALNRKLRKLGISKEDVTVASVGGDALFLQGNWLDRLPGVEPPRVVGGVEYRTGAIGVTPDGLAEALDQLAPGWRDL